MDGKRSWVFLCVFYFLTFISFVLISFLKKLFNFFQPQTITEGKIQISFNLTKLNYINPPTPYKGYVFGQPNAYLFIVI